MTDFLSESSIELHREYLRQKKLKYSILEKSIKKLENANIYDIMKQNMVQRDKKDALVLLGEIKAHELFFDSFVKNMYVPCPYVQLKFGSETNLMNEIYKCAEELCYGYVAICFSRSDIRVVGAEKGYQLFASGEPLLVVDVCEHVYFSDYGFDKAAYLRQAIPHIDLRKITNYIEVCCK